MHFYYAIKRRAIFSPSSTSLLHVRRFLMKLCARIWHKSLSHLFNKRDVRDTLLHCISARTRCHLWLQTADDFFIPLRFAFHRKKFQSVSIFFLCWQFSMHHKAIWCCAIIFRARRSSPLVFFSLMHNAEKWWKKWIEWLRNFTRTPRQRCRRSFLSIFGTKFCKKC